MVIIILNISGSWVIKSCLEFGNIVVLVCCYGVCNWEI